jgi:hypothetical protein
MDFPTVLQKMDEHNTVVEGMTFPAHQKIIIRPHHGWKIWIPVGTQQLQVLFQTIVDFVVLYIPILNFHLGISMKITSCC